MINCDDKYVMRNDKDVSLLIRLSYSPGSLSRDDVMPRFRTKIPCGNSYGMAHRNRWETRPGSRKAPDQPDPPVGSGWSSPQPKGSACFIRSSNSMAARAACVITEPTCSETTGPLDPLDGSYGFCWTIHGPMDRNLGWTNMGGSSCFFLISTWKHSVDWTDSYWFIFRCLNLANEAPGSCFHFESQIWITWIDQIYNWLVFTFNHRSVPPVEWVKHTTQNGWHIIT